MTVNEALAGLVGRWTGTSRLYLSPQDPARESRSDVSIELVAKGKFLALRYTWSEGGEQEGSLVLGGEADSDHVSATWIDSWHMGHKMMMCEGTWLSGGGLSVRGTYPAPPDPDWGWRISVEPGSGTGGTDSFRLRMHNIPPGAAEQLAVQAEYVRTK